MRLVSQNHISEISNLHQKHGSSFVRVDVSLRRINTRRISERCRRFQAGALFKQRLREQMASISLSEPVFDEMFQCDLARELHYTEWEFVKTCKKVKKAGCDPVTFFEATHNPLLHDNVAVLMDFMNMRRIHVRHILQTRPTVILKYEAKEFAELLLRYIALGFSKCHVRRMFIAYPGMLEDFFYNRVGAALEYYLSLGLIMDEVQHIFVKIPSMLGGSFYEGIDEKIRWMLDVVGMDRDKVIHEWLVKQPRNIFRSEIQTFKDNYGIFLSQGFTKEECLEIFCEHPQLLSGDYLDYEDKIKFLRDLLGDERYKEVLMCPTYFTYSYHRRIQQRVKFMFLRGRKVSPDNLLEVLAAGSTEFYRRHAKCTPKEYRYFNSVWSASLRNRKTREEREAMRSISI